VSFVVFVIFVYFKFDLYQNENKYSANTSPCLYSKMIHIYVLTIHEYTGNLPGYL